MLRAPRVLCLYAGLACAALLGGCVTIAPFAGHDDTLQEATVRGNGSAKILWLPISGFISDAPSGKAFGLIQQPSTLARISRALDKAERDDRVKAIVLRINSPGGTVSAADEIHARVRRYHEATGVPVIASFGGLAASGGYYVAMSADTIIAQPTTVTGSIGVLILGVNASALMDKIGLANQTYTSGSHKDIMSPLRKPRAGEHAIVQRVVDSLYDRFVTVVKASRPNLDRSHLDEITDGRIFAADDAQRLGLIDRIGHLDDALALARRRAGVDRARVIRYYRGDSAPATLSSATAVDSARFDVSAAGMPIRLSSESGAAGQPLYLWRPGRSR